MIDAALRPTKDRLLQPLVRSALGVVHPLVFTAASLTLTLAAAVAAAIGQPLVAVLAWLLGRVADGLDGAVARARDRTTDFGGLLDVVGDTIGYAAIPLGIAVGIDSRAVWVVVAVLLATFYINAISWTYLSALLEKRSRDKSTPTSVVMPRGLIEGAETIVIFAIALALPATAIWVLGTMAALVAVTALERVIVARRWLVP
ncbi:MAG: CDP-alcohol phosphatidyltransferase family protein [Actinomycetota bacterium]